MERSTNVASGAYFSLNKEGILSGFYWIKVEIDWPWQVANYRLDHWWVDGENEPISDLDIDLICLTRILNPDENRHNINS